MYDDVSERSKYSIHYLNSFFEECLPKCCPECRKIWRFTVFIKYISCVDFSDYAKIHRQRCFASYHQFSSVIYNYTCQSDAEYIDKTNERLGITTDQYEQNKIRRM